MRLDKTKIDLLRANKIMTIRDLAKAAGVSTTSIVYCNKDLEVTTAGKIAKALGVKVEDLLYSQEQED